MNIMAQGMKAPYTLLKKRSDCHPSKRKDEIIRFGNPDFQSHLEIFMEILSDDSPYPVQVQQGDVLAIALFRSLASYWQSQTGDNEWNVTDAMWAEQTGLARRQIDRVRQSLIQDGVLKHERRGFPASSYYRYQGVAHRIERTDSFSYWPGLSGFIGYKPAAMFCWFAELDKQFETQGYYFYLKMADIQKSLGLSRFQVDQARKKLIEHDLMKERFWGIPAVREFRLRLDGLERLVSEKGTSE